VTEYTIGLASADELSAVATVEVAAARSVPREDIPAEVADRPMERADLEQARRHKRLWTARINGVVVGFVVGAFKDGLPYVCEIDVLPTHGRRGIGKALMGEVIRWARRQGSPYLTLTTFRHLPFNAPFYARLGFEEIPTECRGPEIRAQLEKEARLGLDPARRVAMWCRL
jgi:GNAT superfamily N-acetyltransferase